MKTLIFLCEGGGAWQERGGWCFSGRGRYFNAHYALTIAVLPCFKRKKSALFRSFGAYSAPQTASCHFTCLWHVCCVFYKKPMRPYFFCIIPYGQRFPHINIRGILALNKLKSKARKNKNYVERPVSQYLSPLVPGFHKKAINT